MKTIISLFMLICLSVPTVAQSEKTNPLLHIQKRIDSSYIVAREEKTATSLLEIEKSIKSVKMSNYLPQYWEAYLKLNLSVLYGEIGDKVKAEESINNAIKILEGIENKDAEVLALLAYAQSFSIRYASGVQAGIISQKSRQNINIAKKIDATNIRVWYVAAILDFYTPKYFGGQKQCETFLKKAISLDERNNSNPYLPTWGKEDSYLMLINYLITNDRKDEATEYFKEASSAFPNSSGLHALEKRISN